VASSRLDWTPNTPHYLPHVLPVWQALPDRFRGTVTTTDARVRAVLDEAGVRYSSTVPTGVSGHLLAAGPRDVPAGDPRRLVLTQHGAGLTYDGQTPWPTLESSIDLALCTKAGSAAAGSLRRRGVTVVDVGSVTLDTPRPSDTGGRRLAVTGHWDNGAQPEQRSAFEWIRSSVVDLAAGGWDVVAHHHPADPRPIRRWWEAHGIEFVDDLPDLYDRADVLIADNTSVLYEWATVRPVVVLSPPWYRRHVAHNPRFWAHVPGPQVSHPSELAATVATAVARLPEWETKRVDAVRHVYGVLDGRAAQRAVAAIVAFLDGREEPHPASPVGSMVRMTDSTPSPVKVEHLPDGRVRLLERTYLDRAGIATRSSRGIALLGSVGTVISAETAQRHGIPTRQVTPPTVGAVTPIPRDEWPDDLPAGERIEQSLEDRTVAQLRDMARHLNLPTGGRKAELVARLHARLTALAPDTNLPAGAETKPRLNPTEKA